MPISMLEKCNYFSSLYPDMYVTEGKERE